MEQDFYTVHFDFDGTHYDGRITPEIKPHHSAPASWHVVLNEVFFGYVSKQGPHWNVSEQRPHELLQEVGKQIARHEDK